MAEINKLTDKKLKTIYGKETAKPVMIADGRGLSILVSKKGAVSWSFSYRKEGKLNRIIIGQYPDLSLKQARDKREMLRGLLAEGGDPKNSSLSNNEIEKKVTVYDAIEYWLNEYA